MTSILIIGGGVIGLSAAYHLAKKGADKITVIEKGVVGSGSSSRAAGIITGHLWTETGVKARKISLQRYRELSEELDGYEFQAVGTLNLFDAESWPGREELLPLYHKHNVPYEVLNAAEIAYRWPNLAPQSKPNITGLYDPLGGYSEPHRYIPALSARARAMGIEILEGQTITGFEKSGERFTGVRTTAEIYSADIIISATHIWTNRLLETVGLKLPMKAIVHQRYVTQPLETAVTIPAINANPYGAYIRPAEGGRLLAGFEIPQPSSYAVPSLDFDMTSVTTSKSYPSQLKANLTPLLPQLVNTTWESEHVGLLSFSADNEPILGTLRPGLIVAGSFHSGGFAYNPVAGLLLAELALGESTSIDLRAFAPDRFSPEVTETYLATEDVHYKEGIQRRH